jgi:DNA-binding response OmpR family regulator
MEIFMTDKQKLTVMVVHSDTDICEEFQQTLAAYNVIVSHNGQEAWQAYQQLSGVAVVITEIELPGLDGLSMAQRIYHSGNPTRVLFMANQIKDSEAFLAFNSGFYCLPKPVDPLFLKLSVGTLVQEWQKYCEMEVCPQDFDNLNIDVNAPVLVVEDSPVMRDIYVDNLSQSFGTVLAAENGQEAWDMYQNYQGEIPVVITDMQMPLMDGLKLSRNIRKLSKMTQIVAISGEMDDALSMQFMSVGVSCLPKPIHPIYVRLIVYRSLSRYMELKRLAVERQS